MNAAERSGEGLLTRNLSSLTSTLVGVAALGGLLYLDGRRGYQRWPSAPTELIGIDPAAQEATITFPGLGSIEGDLQAQHIAEATGALTGAHWTYSTDGFTVDQLAKQLQAEAPDLKRMHLNGHSMGGPVGLEVARRSDLALGNVVLHCSPFGPKDARSRKAAWLASNVLKMPGGPGSKFVVAATQRMLRGEGVGPSIATAWRDAKGGCSPRLWTQQLRLLQSIDLAGRVEDYRSHVDANTRAVYIRPKDPEQDPTVHVLQSAERYRKFFADLEVPFTVVEVHDMGHADTQLGCLALAMALREQQGL